MSRQATLEAITYHLPEQCLTNQVLEGRFAGWTARQIFEKTGIRQRHVAAEAEFASDLAAAAAEQLFQKGYCRREDIDILVLCTQSPDYLLPTTACLLQSRLQLPRKLMAFDINQGCSGYVYGLGVVKSLLEAGLGRQALLVTADTYSKFLHPLDRSVATLFGDGAAATLVGVGESAASASACLRSLVFGTDGSGAANLMLASGGARCRHVDASSGVATAPAGGKFPGYLYMNGPEILAFTLRTVPDLIAAATAQAGFSPEQIDLYVFHQANRYILEALQRKLGIAPQRFVIDLEDTGNTVSSSIPIALARCAAGGRLQPGMKVLLAGFGVGYSYGAAVLVWPSLRAPERTTT